MLDLPVALRDVLMPVPHCGCWLYVGTRFSQNGYGRVWWLGRERQVHKVVYELLIQRVPRGLILDHLCRVRSCANPWHLEPVTVRVNTRRGHAILFAPLETPHATSTDLRLVAGVVGGGRRLLADDNLSSRWALADG